MKRTLSQIGNTILNQNPLKRRKLNPFNKRRFFSINNISKTNQFKNMKTSINQEQYYRKNGAPEDILKIVRLSNKAFGEKLQCIIQELLDLEKSSHTGHDAQKVSMDLKFEIKSSRYGVKSKDYMWQHIMEKHNYDYLLLVGIDFNGFKVFIISKKDFMKLRCEGLVKTQGGGEGQGLWCQCKKIEDYLHEIENKKDFYNFLKK